jgi:hypothetical protein
MTFADAIASMLAPRSLAQLLRHGELGADRYALCGLSDLQQARSLRRLKGTSLNSRLYGNLTPASVRWCRSFGARSRLWGVIGSRCAHRRFRELIEPTIITGFGLFSMIPEDLSV